MLLFLSPLSVSLRVIWTYFSSSNTPTARVQANTTTAITVPYSNTTSSAERGGASVGSVITVGVASTVGGVVTGTARTELHSPREN